MGDHKRNPVALEHAGLVPPYQLADIKLMQRAAPDQPVILRPGAPPLQEWRLVIQVQRRGSITGKLLQAAIIQGATAVDLARCLIGAGNFLLQVDQLPEDATSTAPIDQPTETPGNGQDHDTEGEAGAQAQSEPPVASVN